MLRLLMNPVWSGCMRYCAIFWKRLARMDVRSLRSVLERVIGWQLVI